MAEKKELKVVTGDVASLDISPVHNYLNVAKPKTTKEKPSSIVVPKQKKKKS